MVRPLQSKLYLCFVVLDSFKPHAGKQKNQYHGHQLDSFGMCEVLSLHVVCYIASNPCSLFWGGGGGGGGGSEPGLEAI